MTWLFSHVAALLLACSYLVLGSVSTGLASRLWAPYAMLTLVFAVANIAMERGRRES